MPPNQTLRGRFRYPDRHHPALCSPDRLAASAGRERGGGDAEATAAADRVGEFLNRSVERRLIALQSLHSFGTAIGGCHGQHNDSES